MRGLSPKNRRAGLFACLCVAVLLLLFGWFLTTAAKKRNTKKPKKDVSGACPAKTGDPGALGYIESTTAAACTTRPPVPIGFGFLAGQIYSRNLDAGVRSHGGCSL